MLSLKTLRYTVTAAEEESVTLAARRLNVSQPSISGAIAQLEDHYGQALFIRHKGSGISLTPFGRQVTRKARDVLNSAAELSALSSSETAVTGEITIGCFQELAPHYLPALMKAFRDIHPNVWLTVREESLDDLPRLLQEGTIDLMINYDIGLPDAITTQTLREPALHALLPDGHALSFEKLISLEMLCHYPLIISSDHQSWSAIMALFQSIGLRPSVPWRPKTFEMQRGMVAAGLGVSVAFSKITTDLSYDGSRLITRPVSDNVPKQRILMARSTRFDPSQAARTFWSFTEDWFRKR
ncbi:LysR family transcriptional regulator [Coralliovum pocilloporae]|uniref:LysR family transcriptional regulator n=1 Tax=Coralliovum pocilloporae TaxID=3066369 RepID=UPI00330791CD